MSKLFEALEKIEQQSVSEPLLPASSVVKKQSARPFTVIFLILLLLVVIGGVILYYLNHQNKLFSYKSDLIPNLKTGTVHTPAEEKKEIQKTGTKNLPETNSFSEPYKPTSPDRRDQPQQASKNPIAAKQPSTQHQTATSSPEIKNSLSEKQKAFIDRPDPAIQLQKQLEELKKTVQQILYQAEERRKEGDMEAAVILYRRAWKLKKTPATANNLAAGLFTLKKYTEACRLLQEALDMDPDDADLQYNLKITKERLGFQKQQKNRSYGN